MGRVRVALFCKFEINKLLSIFVESFAGFLAQLAFGYQLVQGFAWVEKSFIGVFGMPSIDNKLGSVQTNLGQIESQSYISFWLNKTINLSQKDIKQGTTE